VSQAGDAVAVRRPGPLRDPRIVLTSFQRLVSALAAIARSHRIVVTALRFDHSTYTVDGNVSNHSANRPMDIGAVDEICHGARHRRSRAVVHASGYERRGCPSR
jgi:putative hemolysin